MDERKDPPPKPVTRPPVIVSGVRLSPLQQAYSLYVQHTIKCDTCRDVDRGNCATSEELWRVYQAVGAAAYRQLAEDA